MIKKTIKSILKTITPHVFTWRIIFWFLTAATLPVLNYFGIIALSNYKLTIITIIIMYLIISLYVIYLLGYRLSEYEEPQFKILLGESGVFRDSNKRYPCIVRIGIQNTSARVIHGFELKIINIRKITDLLNTESILQPISAKNREHKKISINPQDIEYYSIGFENCGQPRSISFHQDLRFGAFNDLKVIKIRCSGENAIAQTYYFTIGLDHEGKFIFEPYKENKCLD